MTDPNSALRWLPVVERLAAADSTIRTPETLVVPFEFGRYFTVVADDVGDPSMEEYVHEVEGRVQHAAGEIGYPVFIRNDLTSAKHDGPGSYRADGPSYIPNVCADNVIDAEMKLWVGGATPGAFLVRRWLDLEGTFHAFGGHLIAREFRAFVADDMVDCIHPYWPADAIRTPDTPTWRENLAWQNDLADSQRAVIDGIASRIGGAIGGAWSVDVAYGNDDTWWVIDMATAAESWHPDHGDG